MLYGSLSTHSVHDPALSKESVETSLDNTKLDFYIKTLNKIVDAKMDEKKL